MKKNTLRKFSNLKMHRGGVLGLTIVLIASLITAGTLAWISLNQTALNRQTDESDSGGRLHDDFDGDNKDVYAENYESRPLQVRIRLDEYFEYGIGAGMLSTDPDYSDITKHDVEVATQYVNPITGLLEDSKIDDVTTWTTHIPDFAVVPPIDSSRCDNIMHNYYNWVMGGTGKWYIPTFNKNPDSDSTDATGIAVDGVSGNMNTAPGKSATNPNNGSHSYWSSGDSLTAPANIGGASVVNETHTVKQTPDCTVISMVDWIAAGSPKGKFWVYDEDGWAYWAEALMPQEATGLLLNQVKKISIIDETQHYGINVVAQFAGIDDYSSFSDTANGAPATDEALELLLQNSIIVSTIQVSAPNPIPDFVINVTDEINLDASLTGYNLLDYDDDGVIWSIDENFDGDFDPVTGILKAKSDGTITGGEYMVTATAKADPDKYVTVTIKVVEPYVTGVSINTPVTQVFLTDVTGTIDLDATVAGVGLQDGTDKEVTWSISSSGHGGTFDTLTGVLASCKVSGVGNYTVTATSKKDPSKYGTITIRVKKSLTSTKYNELYYDASGVEWIVLGNNSVNGYKMIMTKDVQGASPHTLYNTSGNWTHLDTAGNNLKYLLKNFYIGNIGSDVKSATVPYTSLPDVRSNYTVTNPAFLANESGNSNGFSTPNVSATASVLSDGGNAIFVLSIAEYYTFVPATERVKSSVWWLRSPGNTGIVNGYSTTASIVFTDGSAIYAAMDTAPSQGHLENWEGYRPVLWVKDGIS